MARVRRFAPDAVRTTPRPPIVERVRPITCWALGGHELRAEVATRAPELAVLSVMLHGPGEDAVAVGEAALAAARGLRDGRDTLYTDLVLASVHAAARAILEAVMASGNYEYQSDFARRYFGQGKPEGIAEGKAEAVLAVLAARRIAVPDEIRARITTCVDVAILDRWLARAITALAAADVVSE